jgi:peptide/nickel transport system permease protein
MEIDPTAIAARSPWQLFWRRFREDRLAMAALIFLVALVVVAILAPLVVKIFGAPGPDERDTGALDPFFATPTGPSAEHIFGIDDIGRDVFSRTIYGARVSLEVAFIATGLIVCIGVTLGMIAGYYRGGIDTVLSRSMDVVLAFPVLLLALGLGAACSLKGCLTASSVGRDLLIAGAIVMAVPVVAAAISALRGRGGFKAISGADWVLRLAPGVLVIVFGVIFSVVISATTTLIQPGLPVVIFVITLAGWPYMARIIRGQVLSIREKEFVEAARSLGASDTRIIFRHILPNLVAPIIVYTTLLIPTNILFEAALSFLGVGVQPPTASWGAMIADAIEIFDTAWWYMTFPGVALLLTVLAFNLVGDGLQDALNPRTGR